MTALWLINLEQSPTFVFYLLQKNDTDSIVKEQVPKTLASLERVSKTPCFAQAALKTQKNWKPKASTVGNEPPFGVSNLSF